MVVTFAIAGTATKSVWTGICGLWLQNGQEWSGMFSGMFRNVRTKAECSDTIPVGTTTKHVRNVRNVFRNVQECENKSQIRWHNPSRYYHQVCQECQEHFQEHSGMWEQKPNVARYYHWACQECQERFQAIGQWEESSRVSVYFGDTEHIGAYLGLVPAASTSTQWDQHRVLCPGVTLATCPISAWA